MRRYHVEDPQDPMNELVFYEEGLGSYVVLATEVASQENVNIDWKEEGIEYQEELRNNKISIGLVPLEEMYDRHDMCKENKEIVKLDEYMEINVGSPDGPKIVKIGKGISSEERREIENLIKEYKDSFIWLYDNLEGFLDDAIQQAIDKVVMDFLKKRSSLILECQQISSPTMPKL
jgi:hypothetical protein